MKKILKMLAKKKKKSKIKFGVFLPQRRLKIDYSQSIMALNLFSVIKILKKLQILGLKYCHIDFADGIYVPNFGANYQIAEYLIKLFPKIEFDAHLMCVNSIEKIEKLVKIGFRTIFLPAEQITKSSFEKLNQNFPDINFGLMIQAKQKIKHFSEIISLAKVVLLMTINKIGGVGEMLNSKLFSKIEQIRFLNKEIKIYTDGGLRKYNWNDFLRKKVDVAIGGNIIFSYENFLEFSKLWQKTKKCN
ncbi:ribulose phosphate epimerase [Mesomycoplasma flocculare]|uniref:ribulose phosphate epimerase n=1 Tax=Mesomycoplasma flocculare TaxID=2128 RepID=UPI00280BDC4E|nr:ribulose phosphate epimerase [Mesomycoplasma flocculare]